MHRRTLLRTTAWGGGLIGVGALAGFVANRFGGHAARRGETVLGEEFVYDVSRFQQTDPSLLLYKETDRFPADLERPRYLACAADGTIFVAGDGGISRFSGKGENTLTISVETPVHSLLIRPDGTIVAGCEDRIRHFSSAGFAGEVWDEFERGLLPTGLAFGEGFLYVADAKNRRILRLDASGRQAGMIGERETGEAGRGFSVPSPYFCVRFAPDGLLRVNNPGAHLIEAYTPDGDFQIAWGKPSFGVEGFCGCCNPVSFDVLPGGEFVTCEKGLPRVKLYDLNGDFLGLVAGPESFPEYLKAANAGVPRAAGAGLYVAVDSSGRILVLDVIGRAVRVYEAV